MDFFWTIIYQVIYQPLVNILIVLYNNISLGDLGFAVIVLTIMIKLLLYPLGLKAARSQKEMEGIQPEIKKIQEKYKDDKETQSKKIMEFYKEKKVNPFSGFTTLFIQLPILISLFQIFRRLTDEELDGSQMEHLYSFVSEPETVNYMFLGLVDLSQPFLGFAVVAAIGQYAQMKITMAKQQSKKEEKEEKEKKKGKEEDLGEAMKSQMIYFLPGFTFIILLTLPSVIGLYWIITVIFAIFQQHIIRKEREAVIEKEEKEEKEKKLEGGSKEKEKIESDSGDSSDKEKEEEKEKKKKSGKNNKGKKKKKNGKRKKKS